jgi:hypothetical protein
MELSSKLGRCGRCIRLTLEASLGCLLVAVVAAAAGAPAAVTIALGSVTAVFACWLAAHGVAYALRGPERATGCRSCAENARAYRRARRWRHVRAWFASAPVPATGRAGCRRCGRRTPVSEMPDALPADEGLRSVAEHSVEFQQLVSRLARPEPVDSWQADMLNYFLYELTSGPGSPQSHALFVTGWEYDAPVSVVVLTPEEAMLQPLAAAAWVP